MDKDAMLEDAIKRMETAIGACTGDYSFARFMQLRRQLWGKRANISGALGEADMVFVILLNSGLLTGQTPVATKSPE